MQDKILELERKINEDKRLLDNMSKTVYEGYSYNAAFIKAKLNNMQSDIEYMEQQLIILKRDVETRESQSVDVATQVQNKSAVEEHTLPEMMKQPHIPHQVMGVQPEMSMQQLGAQSGMPMQQLGAQPRMPMQQMGVQPQIPSQQYTPYQPVAPKAKPKDVEAAVGKTIMGVAASVLIFISLILFATLLIPHLTDTVRLILMYAVSIGFTVFGLLKLNKARDSVLFLSISACGVGSIYISLFVSMLYFNIIDEVTLYLALFVWAVGVCVLSKYRSGVFSIIGQSGIVISVIFGTDYCVSHDAIGKLMVIAIYFIVGSLIFYFTHNSKKNDYILNSVFNLVSVFALYIGMQSLHWEYQLDDTKTPTVYYVAFGVLLVYCLFKMILPLVWSGVNQGEKKFTLLQKYADVTGIVCTIYYFAFSLFLDGLVNNDDIFFVVTLFVAPIYLAVVEYIRRNYNENPGINVMYVFLTLMMVVSVFCLNVLNDTVSVAIIIIPYLVYGYLRNKRLFKYLAIILILPFMWNDDLHIAVTIILGSLIIGGALYFALTKKAQYKQLLKNILFAVLIIFVIAVMDRINYETNIEFETIKCIEFVVLSLITGIAAKTVFCKNPVYGIVEEGTKRYLDIIIAILMFLGMTYISDSDEVFCHVIFIIVTLGLFMLNAVEQLNDEERRLYGPYVGLKFTVLMIVILYSLDAENFLVSIFCFLFAIGSICLGFFVKHKELRIYGLVLSLISVVKLIMIDITYDNTLGHALSFFISGVLCFVISAIYTRVEKKMKDSE